MGRLVSPTKSELDQLTQPLTLGERIVFDFFDKHLAEPWEIYLRSHLNGLRPDIVLLHPEQGIAVFEVKDWDLRKLNYRTGLGRNGRPQILASDGNKEFAVRDPLQQVQGYKQEIYDLYCPRLAEKSGLGVISAGVIFPFTEQAALNKLFQAALSALSAQRLNRLHPIVGQEALKTGAIDKVFPNHARKGESRMSVDLAQDLRSWLVEPDFSETQRKALALELDAVQRNLVTGTTKTGYRRIKGPAGSGKSLVLAARAAELASQGKDVLVVTFNITLTNYLRDLAVRWKRGSTRNSITWLNFHHWCKRVVQDLDAEEKYNAIWKNILKLTMGPIQVLGEINLVSLLPIFQGLLDSS